jgi:hypothetical protein
MQKHLSLAAAAAAADGAAGDQIDGQTHQLIARPTRGKEYVITVGGPRRRSRRQTGVGSCVRVSVGRRAIIQDQRARIGG